MKTSLCLLLASAFDAAKAAPVSAGEVRPLHTRSHLPTPIVCSPNLNGRDTEPASRMQWTAILFPRDREYHAA